MAEITVLQTPVSVELTCDNCEEEIAFDYSEFIEKYGEPCDWDYIHITCPECGHINNVDSWTFD